MNTAGRVPQPVKLGKSTRWVVSELHEWLAAGCPSRTQWVAMKEARRHAARSG
jgi:predicted DNA-binding transcriptional regulator AlpA